MACRTCFPASAPALPASDCHCLSSLPSAAIPVSLSGPLRLPIWKNLQCFESSRTKQEFRRGVLTRSDCPSPRQPRSGRQDFSSGEEGNGVGKEVGDKPVRTLLIDNYDSYTYNLYQLLAVINGVTPVVVKNDQLSWMDLQKHLYEDGAFDNIVISPGPGSPMCEADIGICMQVLRWCHDIPILGVCMGHQALGYANGAQIVHAPEPVHGRLSEVEHAGCPLFDNIPSGLGFGFKVVRYHSLMIDATSLPSNLIPTAWTVRSNVSCSTGFLSAYFKTLDSRAMSTSPAFDGQESIKLSSKLPQQLEFPFVASPEHPGRKHYTSNDIGCTGRDKNFGDTSIFPKKLNATFDGVSQCFTENGFTRVIMAISHRTRPHYGLQFHPESIATVHGTQILENFCKLTRQFWLKHASGGNNKGNLSSSSRRGVQGRLLPTSSRVFRKELEVVSAENDAGTSVTNDEGHSLRLYWKKVCGLAAEAGGSENIFCGLFGSGTAKDTFWLDSSCRQQGNARFSFMGGEGGHLWKRLTYQLSYGKGASQGCGTLRVEDCTGQTEEKYLEGGFLKFLSNELESQSFRKEDQGLPFDFHGGFVGYLGYELKAECGTTSNRHKSQVPDACFFFVDHFVAIDHTNDDVYVLALFDEYQKSSNFRMDCQSVCNKPKLSAKAMAEAWVGKTIAKLLKLAKKDISMAVERCSSKFASIPPASMGLDSQFTLQKCKSQYVEDVKKCLGYIKDGQSYELCLTTQLEKRIRFFDSLGLYLTLRKLNPAPYAAWLHFGREEVCVCCSSPERFLRLDQTGTLEAKPIKGTVPRGCSLKEDDHLKWKLQNSEKDQAENLMIVDLLRNDLGRVCEPGSVHVPSLMAIESYATVHTLVSTIKGKKSDGATPIDCVRAAFPGGSMTGAPKLRAMELLDSLECGARGVYSGAIGFFSINSSFDLNIVIRTIVLQNEMASIGAGGAVVALSDPDDEYEEMLLKSRAPIRAVSQFESVSNLLEGTNALAATT